MSDPGSSERSLYKLAGNSNGKWRMHRITIEQQPGRACYLRWNDDDYVYLYQWLPADHIHVQFDIYCGHSSGGLLDMSFKFDDSILSDAGSGRRSIYDLACNGKLKWWM